LTDEHPLLLLLLYMPFQCLCSCKSEPTSLVERPRIAEEFCPAGCKKLRCVSNDPKAA
jgi:hypothetical protein